MPSWRAEYNDGTALLELDDAGRVVGKYNQIDRKRLVRFIIVGDDNKPIVVLHLKPESRLIYRQRVARRLSGEEERIILVGWQETRGGVNFQSLTAIFRDHIEVIDRFDEKMRWFYPVRFNSEEVTD